MCSIEYQNVYFGIIMRKIRIIFFLPLVRPVSVHGPFSTMRAFIPFPLFFMFNVNRVTLLGNVTHDPEPHTAKTGTAVTSIGFATNYRMKDEKGNLVNEPEFHRLVCFGQLAEFAGKSVNKGAPLYVEGRIHTSKYTNKKGEEASKTEIVLDRLVLLSSKKGSAVAAASEA